MTAAAYYATLACFHLISKHDKGTGGSWGKNNVTKKSPVGMVKGALQEL
jgi:hypothetical protein